MHERQTAPAHDEQAHKSQPDQRPRPARQAHIVHAVVARSSHGRHLRAQCMPHPRQRFLIELKMKSAFCGGVYVAKNTLRVASVAGWHSQPRRRAKRTPIEREGLPPSLSMYYSQPFTIFLNVLPRSMKFLNWSKAAQAGESVTMSPSSARSRAVSTARSKGVTSRISGLPGS